MEFLLSSGVQAKSLDIVALVVGLNERDQLEKCLPSVDFCHSKHYIDIGSTDSSTQYARSRGWQVRSGPLLPAVEMTQFPFLQGSDEDWFLLLDPDETLSRGVEAFLRKHFATIAGDDSIGGISFPWNFYLGNRELMYGPWSGAHKTVLIRKRAFDLRPSPHSLKTLKKGYKILSISENPEVYIVHRWARSWGPLLSKHLRYLRLEWGGAGKKVHGRPTVRAFQSLRKEVKYAFFAKRACADGAFGFLLGLLWVGYKALAVYGSARHQSKRRSPVAKSSRVP